VEDLPTESSRAIAPIQGKIGAHFCREKTLGRIKFWLLAL
jgi:hypothetical protein